MHYLISGGTWRVYTWSLQHPDKCSRRDHVVNSAAWSSRTQVISDLSAYWLHKIGLVLSYETHTYSIRLSCQRNRVVVEPPPPVSLHDIIRKKSQMALPIGWNARHGRIHCVKTPIHAKAKKSANSDRIYVPHRKFLRFSKNFSFLTVISSQYRKIKWTNSEIKFCFLAHVR